MHGLLPTDAQSDRGAVQIVPLSDVLRQVMGVPKFCCARSGMRKVPGAKNAKELLPSVLLNARDDAGVARIVYLAQRRNSSKRQSVVQLVKQQQHGNKHWRGRKRGCLPIFPVPTI